MCRFSGTRQNKTVKKVRESSSLQFWTVFIAADTQLYSVLENRRFKHVVKVLEHCCYVPLHAYLVSLLCL